MNTCIECSVQFLGHGNSKYCCDECRKKSRKRQFLHGSRKAYKKQSEKKKAELLTCQCCGAVYMRSDGGYKYCSRECRIRECSSNRNGIRRARRNGKREFGKAHFIFIYERDEGRCNHCKSSLNVGDRGMNKDESPVLDHIIPLSKGGEHNANNVQLLCNKCNTIKGSSVNNIDLLKIKSLSGDANANT